MDSKLHQPSGQGPAFRFRCLVILCGYASVVSACQGANALNVADNFHVANGQVLVCWKQNLQPSTHLLVHFHGAAETVMKAFQRSRIDAILVVVNFSGLSSAYAKPFERDEGLFDTIVVKGTEAAWGKASPQTTQMQRVYVSTFSAGYGAVREILKTQRHFDRIDAIFAADSIYAGLQDSSTHRRVNQQHMRDFLKFAQQAAQGKKTLIVSHSSQQTTYASTTETADYLLDGLHAKRRLDTSIRTATLQQASHASNGMFTVWGFEGETGQDHMQHLHNIDVLWNHL
jgi:hypothetical protein